MLGRRGAAPAATAAGRADNNPPSFRVPGASVAARAGAAATASGGVSGPPNVRAGSGTSQAARGPEGGAEAGGNRQSRDAETDEEGFQTVKLKGNAWRRNRVAAAATASAREDRGQEAGDATGQVSDHTTGGADATAAEDTADAEGDAAPPCAEDLRQAWMDEVAVVRRLRQQGLASDHPAMEAACAARDGAEAQWREAKDPAPLAIRLSRAQGKLDRAIAAQADSRRAVLDLEKAHKLRLAELQAKLDEDTDKVRLRREQLRAVQDEITTGNTDTDTRARARQGRAVQRVHATLSGTVAPTISALVEQLDSSTPAWTMLNGLLGTLSTSQALLEEAIHQPRYAQRFDIGDGGGGTDADGDDRRQDDDCDSLWSESHELRDRGDTRAWAGDQTMQYDDDDPGHAGAEDGGGEADYSMGTGQWWDMSYSDWQKGVRWESCGHGKWSRTRSSWADSWEEERRHDDEENTQPAAARRRLEPAPVPCATTGERGAATEAGAGAGGDDVRRQQQQHDDRVQHIIRAAIAAGVQPVTAKGEDLHILDADQLAAWAAERLPPNDPL